MNTLVEKSFHALVFAVFFFALAYVLETLTPSKPVEIYELYGSYINTLWLMSLFFVILFIGMLFIAIASKYGIFKNMAVTASKSSIVLGYAINGMGFLCIVYFLMQYVVFPWQQ